jgi:hypothetical protein
MKRIKILFISIVVLSAILIGFAALIPATTKVSRTTSIVAHRDSILQQITNVENWSRWHPQLNNDSVRRLIQYSAQRSGANAWLIAGQTRMEVISMAEGSVSINISNAKGEAIPSVINVIPVRNTDSCIVNWQSQFTSKWYPWERFRSIFIDNMLGPALEANLKSLKAYMEPGRNPQSR